MKQFKVGAIYHSPYNRRYIRVVRRTDASVWVEFLTLYNKSYINEGFNMKRVHRGVWQDAEYIEDAALSLCFYATQEMSQGEFDARCAMFQQHEERVAAKVQAVLDRQVAELREWLVENDIQLDTVEKVLDRFSGVSQSVLEELRNKAN